MTPQMKECLEQTGKLQDQTIAMINTTSAAMVGLVAENTRLQKKVTDLEERLFIEKIELANLRAWLDDNTTFYNTDESSAPVLASVSKRIWYHATDDKVSYPFSHVAAAYQAASAPSAEPQDIASA